MPKKNIILTREDNPRQPRLERLTQEFINSISASLVPGQSLEITIGHDAGCPALESAIDDCNCEPVFALGKPREGTVVLHSYTKLMLAKSDTPEPPGSNGKNGHGSKGGKP